MVKEVHIYGEVAAAAAAAPAQGQKIRSAVETM